MKKTAALATDEEHRAEMPGFSFAFSYIEKWIYVLTKRKLCAIISKLSENSKHARVVELVDSLDSGSSAHSGHAGSSPASRTKQKREAFASRFLFLRGGT